METCEGISCSQKIKFTEIFWYQKKKGLKSIYTRGLEKFIQNVYYEKLCMYFKDFTAKQSFFERQRNRDTEIFLLLIHSQKAHNSWAEPGQRQEPGAPSDFLHMDGRVPST